jgi:hypothetical protein
VLICTHAYPYESAQLIQLEVVIIKYKKKLNQGLVYATLCGGPHRPHPQVLFFVHYCQARFHPKKLEIFMADIL